MLGDRPSNAVPYPADAFRRRATRGSAKGSPQPHDDVRPRGPAPAAPSLRLPRPTNPTSVAVRAGAPRRQIPIPAVARRVHIRVGNPFDGGGPRAGGNP